MHKEDKLKAEAYLLDLQDAIETGRDPDGDIYMKYKDIDPRAKFEGEGLDRAYKEITKLYLKYKDKSLQPGNNDIEMRDEYIDRLDSLERFFLNKHYD